MHYGFCHCSTVRFLSVHDRTICSKCEFDDITFKELPANTIASIVCEEGDANGFLLLLMNKILNHKSSGEAIKIDNDTAGQLA